MKNFSDLLATDRLLVVRIRLLSKIDAGVPWATVAVNDNIVFSESLNTSVSISTQVDLKSAVKIDVAMKDKVYREDLETAVIIESITVDGHELIPNFTHHAVYDNDHGKNIPTNYLGWNGTWALDTRVPFYQWLHHATGQGWLLEPI